MPGLCLGVISGGKAHDEFILCRERFLLIDQSPKGRRQYAGTAWGKGGIFASNRCKVVEQFLETPAEHLLFIDTDIEFLAEDVYNIIDIAGKDKKILSGLYFLHHPRNTLNPAWYVIDPQTKSRDVYTNISNGIHEIDACGMGFCLIHREVFLAMEPHYRKDEWKWFAYDLVEMDGKPTRLGEDMSFCHRAQTSCGYKIYGTGDIRPNHIKERRENLDTYAASKGVKVKMRDPEPTMETIVSPDRCEAPEKPEAAVEKCGVPVGVLEK
jgi:hypothetical protein